LFPGAVGHSRLAHHSRPPARAGHRSSCSHRSHRTNSVCHRLCQCERLGAVLRRVAPAAILKALLPGQLRCLPNPTRRELLVSSAATSTSHPSPAH
jgi:hypothetical protein